MVVVDGFSTAGLGTVHALRRSSNSGSLQMGLKNSEGKAPIINFFDERMGCARESKEYKGKPSGGVDDQLCIKVYMEVVQWSDVATQQFMAELLPQLSPIVRRAKGIIK